MHRYAGFKGANLFVRVKKVGLFWGADCMYIYIYIHTYIYIYIYTHITTATATTTTTTTPTNDNHNMVIAGRLQAS